MWNSLTLFVFFAWLFDDMLISEKQSVIKKCRKCKEEYGDKELSFLSHTDLLSETQMKRLARQVEAKEEEEREEKKMAKSYLAPRSWWLHSYRR